MRTLFAAGKLPALVHPDSMAENREPSRSPHAALLDAAARVLAPLARLLIAKGVSYQMAEELLKRVYVRAGQQQAAPGVPLTGSRLSLITGLNRKEIRRLTSDETQTRPPESITSFASAVYTTWRTQRRWRDRNGVPRALPRYAEGDERSFDELVRSITTDHRPAAVLEELLRLGVVTVGADDVVMLSADAFVIERDFEKQLFALTENLEDHARAVVANVLTSPPPFLERSVFSDALSTTSAQQMHELARAIWQTSRDEIIRRAVECEARDGQEGAPASERIRIGMYFYSESNPKD